MSECKCPTCGTVKEVSRETIDKCDFVLDLMKKRFKFVCVEKRGLAPDGALMIGESYFVYDELCDEAVVRLEKDIRVRDMVLCEVEYA